ncbi:MAG: glycosyltransferase [Bacilli bacterium]|uniref:glycosyltransferase family 8 protein n=1 Tax=Anaerorhabdus sp. TaxID=1872524 RepID=UPI002FCC31B0
MKKRANYFLYAVDDAYIPLVEVSILSIIENNKELKLEIYIVTEPEETENKKKLQKLCNDQIQLNFIDNSLAIEELKKTGVQPWKGSYATFTKFSYLDKLSVDFVWIIDADIICNNSIPEIYINDNMLFGAVLDSCYWEYNLNIGMKNTDKYFNAGVLFMNCKKWKKDNNYSEFLKCLKYKKNYLFADQDIMNIAFQTRIQLLDPSLNWLAGYDIFGIANTYKIYKLERKYFYPINDVIDNSNRIIFYHCLGGMTGKPWERNNTHPYKLLFEKYHEMSSFHDLGSLAGRNDSLFFMIQRNLFKLLPNNIYNPIHSYFICRFLKSRKKL